MVSYITEGNGPSLAATNIVVLVVSWVFASLRVYVRLFLVKSWEIEDWFFVAAQVTFTCLAVGSLEATIHGNGQRLSAILPEDLPIAMQLWYVCEIIYVFSVLLLRLSIGFLLLRICPRKKYVYSIWATIGVMAVASVAYLFLIIFQCAPVQFFWLQFSDTPGKCLPGEVIQNSTIAFSAVCAVTDIIFGVLPIMLIWSLQMNIRAKISASILLSLGIIAGITVIVRIEYVKEVNLAEDFLYATSNVAIWSVIEPTIGIACAAAATFRPLFKSLQDRSIRRYASNNQTITQVKDVEMGAVSRSDFGTSYVARSVSKSGYRSSLGTTHKSSDSTHHEPLARSSSPRLASPSESESEGEILGSGIYCTTTVNITRQPKGEEGH